MKASRMIASVFGIGYFPVLPGTVGSLAGLLLYVLYLHRVGIAFLGWLGGIALIGLLASQRALRGQRETDPSWIVVDEVLGMLVSFAFIPVRWPLLLLGFCLFRFFDSTKIFPVNLLEHLPGAWGILLDDVGAGLYANLLLQLFLKFTS